MLALPTLFKENIKAICMQRVKFLLFFDAIYFDVF